MGKINNDVGYVPDQGAYFRGKSAAERGDPAPAKPEQDDDFTARLFYRGYYSATRRKKAASA